MTSPDDSARSPAIELDPRYIEARRVLLDALIALAPHEAAIVVAGAQAIYLRVGAGEVAVAPYTTDADLVVDPSTLGPVPLLESVMRNAGFHLAIASNGHIAPGMWVLECEIDGTPMLIPVDLIVPDGNAPKGGRRGARLGPHGNRAARRSRGLEAALVDKSPMVVPSLDRTDHRSVTVDVAGEAALLVAKLHKLHDRITTDKPGRLDDKDAADVVRLMQVTSPAATGSSFANLLAHPVAGAPTSEALTYLYELFSRRGASGIRMAARALRTGLPSTQIEAICVAYASVLRELDLTDGS
jgi:hypothetical protein